jgi:hypothetical protein
MDNTQHRVFQEKHAITRERFLKGKIYKQKHPHPKLIRDGDNGKRSFKEGELLHFY